MQYQHTHRMTTSATTSADISKLRSEFVECFVRMIKDSPQDIQEFMFSDIVWKNIQCSLHFTVGLAKREIKLTVSYPNSDLPETHISRTADKNDDNVSSVLKILNDLEDLIPNKDSLDPRSDYEFNIGFEKYLNGINAKYGAENRVVEDAKKAESCCDNELKTKIDTQINIAMNDAINGYINLCAHKPGNCTEIQPRNFTSDANDEQSKQICDEDSEMWAWMVLTAILIILFGFMAVCVIIYES